ncbi:glucarate dehydratase family protein [Micromonospora deserti]|uniref:glucarate dehydratase n=1 Tax=Micromonospora deserti TaxID=2070366 RepID=A0A2W2CQW7_9ACTN|nr:glucarate dehydratase family protein [Micromonospora deserti]PZG01922.1 glucarate dehydratase [Micromonospora deserti]
MRVTNVVVTPVAFRDPPLLNAVGVHQPYALRTVIEVNTEDGVTGLGETYGDGPVVAGLRAVAARMAGLDVFDLAGLRRLVRQATTVAAGTGRSELDGRSRAAEVLYSTFEVALLDAQGKALGRPVVDLLGGRVRDEVPYSAYLFYKWASHPDGPEDDWGPALDPDGIVAQAKRMVGEYGFTAIKVKAGVLPPEQECATIHALADAFPGVPLRIDPNTAWSVPTAVEVGRRLAGVLEYLEDPTPGIAGMAAVAAQVEMPLATNMCVVAREHLPPAIAQRAIGVLLSDHHFWGGLRHTQQLGELCDIFDIGLSMHSNSHLGISLAAMTHVAAATEHLTYACDTHYPWKTEDVVEPGPLRFEGGSVRVPSGAGLGVTLDRDALARLHEQWRRSGIRTRDDVTPMRTVQPEWTGALPRF